MSADKVIFYHHIDYKLVIKKIKFQTEAAKIKKIGM